MSSKIIHYLVSQGRLSFRHTIAWKSDRFRVDSDTIHIIARKLKGNRPEPCWTNDDILGSAGAKLRRLILGKGNAKRLKDCIRPS